MMVEELGPDDQLNKLRWKCRRGMKELDVLLLHYLDHYYVEAEDADKLAFEEVLDMQDPELYFLVLGKTVSDNEAVAGVIETLRQAPRV